MFDTVGILKENEFLKTALAELHDLPAWLAHMQAINKTLEHIPEMAEHIAKMKRWESAIGRVAQL